MVEIANKTDLLVKRDNEGKIIPQRVFIEEIGKDFMLTPLTRGELYRLSTLSNEEQDNEAILLCCKEPSFTKEELKDIKAGLVKVIAIKILEISGIGGRDQFQRSP